MKHIYFACLLVAVALLMASLWIGWRLESPGFATKNATSQESPQEAEALCSQARMKVIGVKASDSCDDIYKRLVRDFGDALAATARTACIDDWVVRENDTLFFPGESLCQRKDLPSDCKAVCDRWRPKHEKH